MIEEFEACIAETSGLIQPVVNPTSSSDNGLLFTSESLHVLKQNGQLTQEFLNRMKTSILSCQVELGLFHRNPYGGPNDQQDDYIGICSLVVIDDSFKEIANQIYSYGFWHLWFYNDVNPGKMTQESFFLRWVYLPSFFKACSGRFLGPLDRLLLFAFFVLNQKNPNQDGCMLGWLMTRPLKGKSWLIDLGINIFLKKYQSLYPNGVYECFKEYSQQPNHPLAKYWLW